MVKILYWAMTVCFLCGCGLIPIPYVERPDSIKLNYIDDAGWWDYRDFEMIRLRINVYLDKNPNIKPEIKNCLQVLEFEKGMNAEQIILEIGEPKKIKKFKDNAELWIYSGAHGGVLQWYYQWGKLKFKDGYLIDIEVQNVHMADL